MPLTRRYTPEHSPGESCLYGMDFSYVIPPGVGITSATIDVGTDQTPGPDWAPLTAGPTEIRGRTVYARLTGGHDTTDYWLKFTATDTDGNIWPRTGMILCARTS